MTFSANDKTEKPNRFLFSRIALGTELRPLGISTPLYFRSSNQQTWMSSPTIKIPSTRYTLQPEREKVSFRLSQLRINL